MNLISSLFQQIDSNRWSDLHLFFSPEAVYERPGYAPLRGLAAIVYSRDRVVAEGKHFLEGCLIGDHEATC